MYSVLVLMSTYNGEKYLKEQIYSILDQKNVNVSLLIRDDGSTDKTKDIIKEFAKKYSNVNYYLGKNVGYEQSFMDLLYTCADNYDFYAFADQDDFWQEVKLEKAVQILGNKENVRMYHSYMTEVDSNLNILSNQQNVRIPRTKEMRLFQNFCQGSTIVLTNSLKKIVSMHCIKKKYPHDVWIPIVASYLGETVYDNNSYVYYRKHSRAVTEMMKEKYYIKLIKNAINGKLVENYSIELLNGYKDLLKDSDICLLMKLKEYYKISNKITLLFDKNFRKFSFKGTLMLKIALLTNRLEKE